MNPYNKKRHEEGKELADKIYQYYKDHEGIKTKELARIFNRSQVHIGAILREKRGRVIGKKQGAKVVESGVFKWEHFDNDIFFGKKQSA